MMDAIEIKEITTSNAKTIISTRQPLGLFYLIENGVYVGIEEEFLDFNQCKEWLRGL